jgi:hypothetical protein
MMGSDHGRRDFLKLGGAGVAGAVTGLLGSPALAARLRCGRFVRTHLHEFPFPLTHSPIMENWGELSIRAGYRATFLAAHIRSDKN